MEDKKKPEEPAEERGKKMIEMDKKVDPKPEPKKDKELKDDAEKWRNEG